MVWDWRFMVTSRLVWVERRIVVIRTQQFKLNLKENIRMDAAGVK